MPYLTAFFLTLRHAPSPDVEAGAVYSKAVDGAFRHGPLPPLIDPWIDLPLETGPQATLEAVRAGDFDRVMELLASGQCQHFIHGRQSDQAFREVSSNPGWPSFDAGGIAYGEWHRVEQSRPPDVKRTLVALRRVLLAKPWELPSLPVDVDGSGQITHINSMLACDPRRAHRNTLVALSREQPLGFGQPPTPRLAAYRPLEAAVTFGWTELLAGRLALAESFSQQASTLGPAEDHQRDHATDMLAFLRVARGKPASRRPMALSTMLAGPRGPNPLYTGLWLLDICLLSVLLEPEAMEARAANARAVAARLGSPRMLAQADAWLGAAHLLSEDRVVLGRELPAILQEVRRATPGLRALPLFLTGVADQSVARLRESVHLARATGQAWLELAGLTWLVKGGDERAPKALHRLIRATGWRALMLVPQTVQAAAAVQLVACGERSGALLEFALASKDDAAILAVASAHLQDHVPSATAAAMTLARLQTSAARQVLESTARNGEGQAAAAATVAMHTRQARLGLSPREVEVLKLVGTGLTNQQIGARLSISSHTVARHLENARTKLGASNRTEAAARVATGWSDVAVVSPLPDLGLPGGRAPAPLRLVGAERSQGADRRRSAG